VNHVISRGVGAGAMVAVVIPEQQVIHFMQVSQNRTGKRSITGVRSFESPRDTHQAAVFTD
jgi:hypothetical protein